MLVVTVTANRTFSVFDRMKNTLRTSMTQSWHSYCLLANFYKRHSSCNRSMSNYEKIIMVQRKRISVFSDSSEWKINDTSRCFKPFSSIKDVENISERHKKIDNLFWLHQEQIVWSSMSTRETEASLRSDMRTYFEIKKA